MGLVDQDLVTAALYFEHDTQRFELAALGVALGHQGRGLGRAALRDALQSIAHRAYEAVGDVEVEVEVTGMIWHENEASMAMALAVGLHQVDFHQDGEVYEFGGRVRANPSS